MSEQTQKSLYAYCKGFTFFELIITMCILIILVTMAAPMAADFVHKSRAKAMMYRLQAAVLYARSMAVTTGENILFCGSSDGLHCDKQWSAGHIVRFESDDHQQPVLRQYPKVANTANLHLSAFPSNQWLCFYPSGYNKFQNGSFTYTDVGITAKMIMSVSGRYRFEMHTST